MKTAFKFFIPLILGAQLFFFKAKAQDYIPMLDGSPEWYYFGLGPAGTTIHYSYQGDTILNKLEYKTFRPCNYYYYPPGPCSDGGDFFLREDTTEQQVFLLIPPYSREILLYDFSLEVGDSIRGEMFAVRNGEPTYDTILCIVKSVSTMQTLADERKVIEIQALGLGPLKPAIWVEGIGNIFGLLEVFYPSFGELTCFYNNGQKIYEYLDFAKSFIFVSECVYIGTAEVDKNDYNQPFLNILPNPVSSILNISLDITGSFQCQIINSTGKTVYSSIMQKELRVDVSGFPTGVYFVKVYGQAGGQEGGWTGKVVVGE